MTIEGDPQHLEKAPPVRISHASGVLRGDRGLVPSPSYSLPEPGHHPKAAEIIPHGLHEALDGLKGLALGQGQEGPAEAVEST